jgi:hypothetical protein
VNVDVRIGVTYTAREIDVELPDDADRDAVKGAVEQALKGDEVLWLTDKRGRHVGIPSAKIAYVEIGGPDDAKRIGFGA